MNAPTLLVGLGGTGSEIVQRVYQRATPKQRQKIGFVVFDTDINEMRAIEERTPKIKTIQTSTRLTVGEYLDADKYSRDNWFPVNRILNGKALTDGAGQVRAVSRLALNTAIQQGKLAPLNEAIEELYKLKPQKAEYAPRVILAGSLCGGTGSGLILPVAMYIRNYLTTKLQQASASIRGFFLLPEVFDGVIKTQSERSNLRCNAYAAVREIDAFLMKADGSLPERFDLRFMLPRPGSVEQEEINGKPMDFCFLFDAQNLSGMKLNSFDEYKAHAANCIYAMAIAPTSKRSNSSEDNVIREVIYAGGRNRYAGAGSSMLIYPCEDVKRYLALLWTKESITDEWLDIDKRFVEELKTNRAMRRKGYRVPPLKRDEHYVDVVEVNYAQNHPFSVAIRDLCTEFDADGFGILGFNWTSYVRDLKKYIDARVEERKKELTRLRQQVEIAAQAATESTVTSDTLKDWYKKLLNYKSATIKSTSAMARNLSYGLFKERKDFTQKEDKFRLEYWLHPNGIMDAFMHPNAMRYFLYKANQELKAREAKHRGKMKSVEDYWNGFEREAFDIPETEHKENLDEFIRASHIDATGLKRFLEKRSISEACAQLKSVFSELYSRTEEYWEAYLCCNIFSDAMQYIDSLCAAFHSFYDVLDASIENMDHDIQELERKYAIQEGEAARYVCANATCLRGLGKDAVNSTSSLEIPAEINRRIFNRMKEFALSDQKPKAEEYFTATFRETVVAHLEKQICSENASIVDMDIISALEREARYMDPQENYELDAQRLYARRVIESTGILAKPFIESPVGKEPRVIPACAYHPSLATADFPGRSAFVSRYLKDNGGVDDESIEPNMILFYQAVYDLRANELSKFAPPKAAQTCDRPGGDYYKAYVELIQNLHPITTKSRVITPHIDRWWHVISKLPDLDEMRQDHQERRVNAAFLWAILSRFVQMRKVDRFTVTYFADKSLLGLRADDEIDQLVVSNGTPCDHLYEVLDAFTIYPRLVNVVMEKATARVDRDISRRVSLEDSCLMTYLEDFRVAEYPLRAEDGTEKVRSVFELPLLMKRSVPAEAYYEENVIRLLDVITSELRGYLGRFCSRKDFAGVYGTLLLGQFRRFMDNCAIACEDWEDLYGDTLFRYICSCIDKELVEIHMDLEAYKIRREYRSLTDHR